jgi:aminoglycoside phosphotransferase (APT) family kinase protein
MQAERLVWKVSEVRDFLGELLGVRIVRVRRVAYGNWSTAYYASTLGNEYVLRLSRIREDFDKDAYAGSFRHAHIPVPKTHLIGEIPYGYFAVSERMRGRYLDSLTGDELTQALPAIARLVWRISRVETSATSGYGVWAPDGNASFMSWQSYLADTVTNDNDSRIFGWQARLKVSDFAWKNFQQTVSYYLPLVSSCPETRHLIHGDLLNYNILLSGKDEVSGVMDWGWSKYGDPLYDLARLCFWAPTYKHWERIDLQAELQRAIRDTGLTQHRFATRMHCYKIHVGLISQQHLAFKRRWRRLELVSHRTRQLACGS